MMLLSLALLACEPLRDGAAGCPAPCPSSCPGACLPAGYCSEVRTSPPAAPALIRSSGTPLAFTLGELPPDSAVEVSLHASFDFPARGSTVPWDYRVKVSREGEPVLDLAAFNAVDFPAEGDWRGRATTDAQGTLRLPLWIDVCEGRAGRSEWGCAVLPSTTVTARVLDTTPWETEPPCP